MHALSSISTACEPCSLCRVAGCVAFWQAFAFFSAAAGMEHTSGKLKIEKRCSSRQHGFGIDARLIPG